jgi:uncharacterized membrane protein YdbT with pleckstrin-like domain
MQDHYLQSLLGNNEKVLMVTRQHWFVLVQSILLELFLMIVIIVAVTGILVLWLPGSLIVFGYLLLIIPLFSLFIDFLVWSNRKYVITNRRVMQLSGVFNKNITDSSLEKVNDVKMEQSFWGRLFNFGDMEILTGSEQGVNLFRKIENPVHFKTTMLDVKEKIENHDQMDENRIDDVPGLITQLDKLRQQGILSDEEFQQKKTKLLGKI